MSALDPSTARCGRCNEGFQLPCTVTVHNDKPYHEMCWTCIHCAKPVVTQFYIDPATPLDPWCPECYLDNQMTCVKCHSKIPPNTMHYPEGSPMGGPMHVHCLRCARCNSQVGANGEIYPYQGAFYCSTVCVAQVMQGAQGIAPPRTDLAYHGPLSNMDPGRVVPIGTARSTAAPAASASASASPSAAPKAATPAPTPAPAPVTFSAADIKPYRPTLVTIKPRSDCCLTCSKKVYQYELVKVNDCIFHKFCLKCTTCKQTLNMKTVQMSGESPYCAVHLPKSKPIGSTTVA